MSGWHNHSELVANGITGSDNKRVKQGAAGGMAGVAAGAQGGSNALVAANGILGGHAMKAMVGTVGAKNTALALRSTGGASSATIVLPIGMLGYQFACDVRRYWKGEIDGVDLVEDTTKNLASLATGGAGGWAGAVLGAEAGLVGGPVGSVFGAVVGAVAGGILGAFVGNGVAEGALKSFFGGSCDQRSVLRKSFRVLDLDQSASNDAIRKRYLRLCQQHHPDKGGDKAKFIEIHSAYEIIRSSRDQTNRA